MSTFCCSPLLKLLGSTFVMILLIRPTLQEGSSALTFSKAQRVWPHAHQTAACCAVKAHVGNAWNSADFLAERCIFRAHACNFCAFFGQIVPKRGVSAGCRTHVSREAACVHALFYQKRVRVRITRLRRRTLVSMDFCIFNSNNNISTFKSRERAKECQEC